MESIATPWFAVSPSACNSDSRPHLTTCSDRGKPRQLTDDAIAWIVQLACQKPKGLGYAQELWTYRLLTQHVRRHGPGVGYPALQKLSRSKLHHLLTEAELRPHK